MSPGNRSVDKVIAAYRRSREAKHQAVAGPLPRHPYRGGPEVASAPALRSAAFLRASWGRFLRRALRGVWRQWGAEQAGPEIVPRLCVAAFSAWLWTNGWLLVFWLVGSLLMAALECCFHLWKRILPRLRRLRGTGCA